VRDDRERLRDVLEAIERIEKYAVRGRTALENEDLLQTWVVHPLMIVGEACRALSGDFRTRHPDEVWVLSYPNSQELSAELLSIGVAIICSQR
jgi:uncharacterized protein with HEPN domain